MLNLSAVEVHTQDYATVLDKLRERVLSRSPKVTVTLADVSDRGVTAVVAYTDGDGSGAREMATRGGVRPTSVAIKDALNQRSTGE